MKYRVPILVSLLMLTSVAFSQGKKYNPPAWAPSAPVGVQYYYIPEIEVYYDADTQRYIYQEEGKWVKMPNLPARYKNFDLNASKPIYLTNYKGNTPYVLFKEHKVKHRPKR